MLVFCNDRFVPESEARISVFDRGFLYGDGLFETVRVANMRPFRWMEHAERFQRGAEFLRIHLPCSTGQLAGLADTLLQKNKTPDCMLRLTLSRGAGPPGYRPDGAQRPTLVISTHPAPALDPAVPAQWRLITSAIRVYSADPLLRIKTGNKLPQVIARHEAVERGADEALLLNEAAAVTEASGANLFWIEGATVCTTPISAGVLPGITRAAVLDLCRDHGIPTKEKTISPAKLASAAGVFLSLSSWGIVESLELDGVRLNRWPGLESLHAAYVRQLMEGS